MRKGECFNMERFFMEEGAVKCVPADGVCFSRRFDVIVCGLGTAGSVAAAAAGQKGFRFWE